MEEAQIDLRVGGAGRRPASGQKSIEEDLMWNYASTAPPVPVRRVSRGIALSRAWRLWGIALVLAGVLLLAGCPYSGIPLGEPDPADFEEGLLGVWIGNGAWIGTEVVPTQGEDSSFGEADTLIILRFNRAEYLSVFKNQKDSTVFGRAFATRVGDALFFNMQEQDLSAEAGAADSITYSLARVRLSGDDLELRMVSDSVGTAQTSAELRALVASRLDDPRIYEDEVLRLRRRKP
jgi:hypothetical protein